MKVVNLKINSISRTFSIVLLITSVCLFTECKRTSKDEVALGGEKKVASSNFYVMDGPNGKFVPLMTSGKILSTPSGSPSGIPASFKSSKIYFAAKFSEVVSWNVTLIGSKSGAQRIFSGISDSVGHSNSLWDGNSTGIPFFGRDELVIAKLTVLGSPVSYVDTFNIVAPKSYDSRYIILDDFEVDGGGKFPLSAVSYDALDVPTVQYSASKEFKVSGAQSLHLKGTDLNWNGYLIAKTTENLFTSFKIKQSDPSQLYFNLYIYGTGAKNTTISLELFENEQGLPDAYNSASNDGWIYDVIVDWEGWKLVSIPYQNFKKAPNPLSGGNGNGIKEPLLISGASVTLNSYPVSGKSVEAYVDFVVLSENGPFVQ